MKLAKSILSVILTMTFATFWACGDDESSVLKAPDGDEIFPDGESSSSSQKKNYSSSSSSFSSSSFKANAFIDNRDGHVYRVVKVGDQLWMADNLNYFDSKDDELSSRSACLGDLEKNCDKFGRLYTFEAAQNVCPEGWHLPSDGEWQKVKSSEFDLENMTFVRTGEKSSLYLEKNDEYARYWTSTECNTLAAYEWYISETKMELNSQQFSKKYFYGVRCVADDSKVKLDAYKEEPKRSSSSTARSSSSMVRSSSSFEESSSSQESSSSVYSSSVSSSSVLSSSSSPKSSSSSEIVLYSVTKTCENCNAFTDERDGKVYKVVVIGKQIWMADNLCYDGVNGAIEDSHKGDFDIVNCKSGNLYNWATAQKVCPEGWTLPSGDDFYVLSANTDGNLQTSGFVSYPTGEGSGLNISMDDYARYWTSSEENMEWYFHTGDESWRFQYYNPKFLYGVRCIATGDVVLDAVATSKEEPAESSSSEPSSSSAPLSSDSSVSSSDDSSVGSSDDLSSSSLE